jgi:pilus assembly protein CpaE
MIRVLLIDDEVFYFKLVAPVIKKAGFTLEYARNGNEGLAKLPIYNPDIIVLDLRLPDLTGFDILARIRRDPTFSNTPVIFVTGQNELNSKLKAFELGADDYLEKPFQPEELVARLGILARRGKAIKMAQQYETEFTSTTTTVAVHSLRGGVGCTSIAVNLALAFYQIWAKPTVLVDAVLASGQVAMMLDASPRSSWEDVADVPPASIDDELLSTLVSKHESGIQYIAAPKFPIAADSFQQGFFLVVAEKLIQFYDFVVMDVAHDFSDISIELLSSANIILLVLAPEMASLRAAIGALQIYDQLGFAPEKIKVALNHNSSSVTIGIKQSQIEKALGHPIDLIIPYGSNDVSRAINFGEPFLLKNRELPISMRIEEIGYLLSNDIHKNIPPAAPTPAYRRVTKRLNEKP